jgi:hypothetical protein
MQRITIQLFFIGMLFSMPMILGYGLPSVNLGYSSFLDGGPLRPRPGLYFQAFFVNYYSNKFVGPEGKQLPGINNPHFNDLSFIASLTYQFNVHILKALPGISVSLPMTLSSKISRNQLCITAVDQGIGDLVVGPYLQWSPGEYREDARLIQRIEFDVKFPTGKNNEPKIRINPGDNVFCINPYWAATFYILPRWAVSWRLYYLWCTENRKTGLKAGDAFHMIATTEYEAKPNLWIGINSYFVHQLKNDHLNGIKVPNSKEQVLGIGPGFLYSINENYDLVFFGNLYFETFVKNRPQGINAVLRLFKYFD